MNEKILKLLRTENKVIGIKQVTRAAEEGKLNKVIAATDSDGYIKEKIIALAGISDAPILWCDSMQELGRESGIDISAAVVGIMKETE
jgi:large subunit ribosomal protein L7A